jgi:predicted nucleic acid-binding protein
MGEPMKTFLEWRSAVNQTPSEYAFEVTKTEMFFEDCEERVVKQLRDKFGMGESEATKLAKEAIEKWTNIYYPD